MEVQNQAIIRLFDLIKRYKKELYDRPAGLFTDEDRKIMQIINELSGVVDKYVDHKE